MPNLVFASAAEGTDERWTDADASTETNASRTAAAPSAARPILFRSILAYALAVVVAIAAVVAAIASMAIGVGAGFLAEPEHPNAAHGIDVDMAGRPR